MPTGLSAEQKDDLAWASGYRARLQGKPRPTGPTKAQGWDDADALIKLSTSHGSGGYGSAVT